MSYLILKNKFIKIIAILICLVFTLENIGYCLPDGLCSKTNLRVPSASRNRLNRAMDRVEHDRGKGVADLSLRDNQKPEAKPVTVPLTINEQVASTRPTAFGLSNFLQKIFTYYFESKPFEENGKIYKRLGVEIFQKYILRKRIPPRYRIGKFNSAPFFIAYTKRNERAHAVSFMIVAVVTVLFFVQGKIGAGVIALILNVIMNTYPIMVQRYNRHRIERILEKKNKISTILATTSLSTPSPIGQSDSALNPNPVNRPSELHQRMPSLLAGNSI